MLPTEVIHLLQNAFPGQAIGDVAPTSGGFSNLTFEADDIQALEPREFIVQGDNVSVLGWERARAVPSGKVFETDWVHVFTVRDGRVVRFWGIYDTEASASARS